jgi:flagellar protein FliS
MSQNPYQNYKQVAIQTASPEKLIVMLYDGAIRFATQAKLAMTEQNIKQTNQWLNKLHDVIHELMASLDMESGGEIANNLFRIYEYCNHRLLEANIKKDPAILEEVTGIISELKDSWVQAMQQLREEVR